MVQKSYGMILRVNFGDGMEDIATAEEIKPTLPKPELSEHTTHDSEEGAIEKSPTGRKSHDNVTFTIYFNDDDPVHAALMDATNDPGDTAPEWEIEYPSGKVHGFSGWLSALEPVTAQNGHEKYNGTIELTGPMTFSD